MLPFRRYWPQGVGPYIQPIRAVWPAKANSGDVTVRRHVATGSGTPRCGVDAVIQSKQPSVGSGMGAIQRIGAIQRMGAEPSEGRSDAMPFR